MSSKNKKLLHLAVLITISVALWAVVLYESYKSALATGTNTKAANATSYVFVDIQELPDRESEWVQQLTMDCSVYTADKPQELLRHKLTDAEVEILARIIQAEAETEGLTGKALVACVVFNRIECTTEFGNDVESVVFEKGQFSPVRSGGRYWKVVPDKECYEAINMVLHGWDESEGALYFESCRSSDNWHSRNLEFLFKYGGHRFYK